jgi:hypothetical protein
MHAMVVISVQMLDAGYLTLAIQECTHGELQNHPASRNQYPGSVKAGDGFFCSSLDIA